MPPSFGFPHLPDMQADGTATGVKKPLHIYNLGCYLTYIFLSIMTCPFILEQSKKPAFPKKSFFAHGGRYQLFTGLFFFAKISTYFKPHSNEWVKYTYIFSDFGQS